jgi:magnesium-transporting ATPase (P-type)
MEAMLTGESVPVSKNLITVSPTAALGDRKCMCYSATTVSAGQGVGVVTATGDRAEIGKISKMVNQVGLTFWGKVDRQNVCLLGGPGGWA